MNNAELLLHLGFEKRSIFILDKPTIAYFNPHLINEHTNIPEVVFITGEFEDKPAEWILRVITATASNNGSRWKAKEMREKMPLVIKQEMAKYTKKLMKAVA